MTVHKSEGQTLDKVVVWLEDPVFGHGQLDQMIMNAVASDPVPGTGIDDTSVSRQLRKTNLGKRMRKLGTISYNSRTLNVTLMSIQIRVSLKQMLSCNRYCFVN